MTVPVLPPQQFPLGAVLTVAVGSHDRPYCNLADLYAILGYLLATVPGHESLQDAIDYCRPAVLAQHPQLAGLEAMTGPDVQVMGWLQQLEHRFGQTLTLTSLQAR